jgi:hypothetical protein
MPIPAFTQYGLLPPGIHNCTPAEIVARYCDNPNRAAIWANLQAFTAVLRRQNWGTDVLIDGGFTSDKLTTKDIDIVFDISHLAAADALGALGWLSANQANFAAQYQVDFWMYHPLVGNDLRAFFAYVKPAELIQRNAPANTPKGLLRTTL